MKTIEIKTQTEWDALPKGFDDFTVIEIKSNNIIIITSNPINSSTVLRNSSSAVLRNSSSAVLRNSSRAVLRNSSSAVLRDSSSAVLRNSSSAELRDSSSAVLWDSSSAELWDSSRAVLRDSSSADYNNDKLLKYLEISPMGSRQYFLKVYICSESVTICTGCFTGSIEDFIKAVVKTHSDNSYAKEYLAAIEYIKIMVEIYRGKP